MSDGNLYLFQLVVCWFFTFTGQCEPVMISQPIPLAMCERAQVKVRLRPGKHIMAYCL